MNNITLSYILAFSKNTWFWLGVWIFYYLRFTNYAGIGIVESVLIITLTLFEIPTGAIADLLGKKKTLIVAFFLETFGAVIMATALNLEMLLISVFIMCVGSAFYSGTIDALLFDTLKEKGQEDRFSKIIANINSVQLIAPAICGIIGGYLYLINPTYPFWANALGYFVGLIASFFLIEPKIDSIKFSFKKFLKQTKQGYLELYKNTKVKRQVNILLTVGFFVVIASEMLDSFLSFEFGFSEIQMGILWSVIFLLSALASQFTDFFGKKLGDLKSVIWAGLLTAVTFAASPFLGLWLGGVSLILRSALQGIYNNLTSILINNNTESSYRATTLSTFNMIKNIPYLATAYFIGSLSDSLSAKVTALFLGLLLIVTLVPQLLLLKKKSD